MIDCKCPLCEVPVREFRWAVGVTTVPSRAKDLLPQTLHSLRGGGFESPRLFVDGCEDPVGFARDLLARSPRFDLAVTGRWPAVKCAPNWHLSMLELFLRDPHADFFAIFQDDLICSRNLRGLIERGIPPKAYLNLFTYPVNQQEAERQGVKQGWFKAVQRGKGAVGLVFPNAAVKVLLSSFHMINRMGGPRWFRSVDGGIVQAMNEAGWAEHCHLPSPLQHVGVKSCVDKSIGSTGKEELFEEYSWPPDWQARSFRGEDFDLLSLAT
jgi:hypothetical protein